MAARGKKKLGKGGGKTPGKQREKHFGRQESFPDPGIPNLHPRNAQPIPKSQRKPLESQAHPQKSSPPALPGRLPLSGGKTNPWERQRECRSRRRVREQQFQAGNIPCLPFPSFQRLQPRVVPGIRKKNRGGGRGGEAPETFREKKPPKLWNSPAGREASPSPWKAGAGIPDLP